ncbi:hypothetical protein GCM10020295_81500 [Streptomyces cinereospinus]
MTAAIAAPPAAAAAHAEPATEPAAGADDEPCAWVAGERLRRSGFVPGRGREWPTAGVAARLFQPAVGMLESLL